MVILCHNGFMPRTPESRAANRDAINEYQRAYYARNRDKYHARTRNRTPEQRERAAAQSRAYYAANREKSLARSREYQIRNRDQISAQTRAYRAANQDKIRAQRSRSRESSAWYKHGMRPEDKAAMWQAQDGCCYLCGEDLAIEKAHVDHDHSCCARDRSCPVCRRGLACEQCNRAIGLARDDPARLRRMADALEAANREVMERMAGRGEPIELLF